MSWQKARFIDPNYSVFQREIWVEGTPQLWTTKYSAGTDGSIRRGEFEARGFATNVLGVDDGIRMVAYLHEIELLNEHADDVPLINWDDWAGAVRNGANNLQ